MEVVSGDHRFPLVANEAAKLIEAAVERLGYGVDEAVCIICQVAADYARSEYGNDYLAGLANVVISRGEMPLPPAESGADDRLSEAKECLETRDETNTSPPEDERSKRSGGWEPIETAPREEAVDILASTTGRVWFQCSWDEEDQCWVTFNRYLERDPHLSPAAKAFEPKWWIALPQDHGGTMSIPNWDRLSREQKISLLARDRGEERTCPNCGRRVAVVLGYWTQHTDPQSWGERARPRQCANELTEALRSTSEGGGK